jgi:integrase
MAWVKKRGNRYHVQYRDDDGMRQAASTHARKLDADRALRDLQLNVDKVAGFDPKGGSLPVGEWSAQWLSTRHDIKPKTRAGYESLLQSRILPTFGTTPVNKLTPGMVDEGLSPARIRQAHQLLSAMMKAALRRGLVGSNPADGTPLPAATKREQRFLTVSELAAFAGAMPERLRASAWTLGVSGLRFGEMSALTRSDVDVLRRQIEVRRSVSEVNGTLIVGTPKNGKTRTVAIPATLAGILNDQLLSHPHDLVFPDTQGGLLRIPGYRKHVKAACAEIGIDPIRTHDLRHTAASLMLAAEPDVFVAMKQLGHSSIKVTVDVYGHLLPGSAADAADTLDQLIADGMTQHGRVVGFG